MKIAFAILGLLALPLAHVGAQSPRTAPAVAEVPANTTSRSAVSDLLPAHPIYTVDPKYPKEARKQKKHGTVVLRVKIGEDGKVKDLAVVSGDSDFGDAAIQAVRKWRFQPYLVDGRPSATEQSVTINFKLENDAAWTSSAQSMSNDDFNREVAARIAAGELFHAGKDVTPPKLISYRDPDYTQAAKDARVSGVEVLQMIVEPDGVPGEVHVARTLDYGLDDKAVETVRQWRFKPSTKDGRPVAVVINIEVTFHLY